MRKKNIHLSLLLASILAFPKNTLACMTVDPFIVKYGEIMRNLLIALPVVGFTIFLFILYGYQKKKVSGRILSITIILLFIIVFICLYYMVNTCFNTTSAKIYE